MAIGGERGTATTFVFVTKARGWPVFFRLSESTFSMVTSEAIFGFVCRIVMMVSCIHVLLPALAPGAAIRRNLIQFFKSSKTAVSANNGGHTQPGACTLCHCCLLPGHCGLFAVSSHPTTSDIVSVLFQSPPQKRAVKLLYIHRDECRLITVARSSFVYLC